MSHMGEKVSAFSSKTKIFTHMNPFVLCEKKNSASFKKNRSLPLAFLSANQRHFFFSFFKQSVKPAKHSVERNKPASGLLEQLVFLPNRERRPKLGT